MRIQPILAALFLTPTVTAYAQDMSNKTGEKPAYDIRLLVPEPDPAFGNSSFKPSSQARGLRGADGIVYWLSADQQSVSAYQNTKLLWTTNLVAALPPKTTGLLTARSMAWCSNALFFSVGSSGYVELNRQTGKVNQAGIN